MISPQSEHDGASCWYRNVALAPAFGVSAFFGGITNVGLAAATLSMNDRSRGVGVATLAGTGVAVSVAGVSRTITPAAVLLSLGRDLMASHFHISSIIDFP